MSEPVGPVQPSAKERLQATREALMHELVPSTRGNVAARRAIPMNRTVSSAGKHAEVPETPRASSGVRLAPASADQHEREEPSGSGLSGWFAIARHSARAWWEFHPVRVAGVIAEPVFSEYARKRPLKLIGIAAGVGAVMVVTRPWRLVSLGSLAIAALKSSQVSNFALTFLSNRKNNRKSTT